jgi:hypothetical protein
MSDSQKFGEKPNFHNDCIKIGSSLFSLHPLASNEINLPSTNHPKIPSSLSNHEIYDLSNSASSSSLGSPLSLSLEGEFLSKLVISKKTTAVQKMISELIQDETNYPEVYQKEATVSVFDEDLIDLKLMSEEIDSPYDRSQSQNKVSHS